MVTLTATRSLLHEIKEKVELGCCNVFNKIGEIEVFRNLEMLKGK